MRTTKIKGDEVVILDESTRPPSPAPARMMVEGDLVIFEDPAAGSLRAAELVAELKKWRATLDRLNDEQAAAQAAAAQRAQEIRELENLAGGAGAQLRPPKIDTLGRPVLEGPARRLAELRRADDAAEKAMAERALAIETTQTKLAELTAEAERLVIDGDRHSACTKLADEAVTLANAVDAAGKAFGKALRTWHAKEQELAARVGTQRAQRALDLAAEQMRFAIAASASGIFELDPGRAGPRGAQAFLSMPASWDPTSNWRGKTLAEICRDLYEDLVREACRGG